MAKLYMENLLHYARAKYGIAYDIYRMSNVYGEDQVTQKGLGFIHAAIDNVIHGKPITIFGDGTNARDYIYIDDVCRFLLLSIDKPLEDSDIYNVCSSTSVSLNDILDIMRNGLKMDFKVEFLPGRKSDVPAVCLDNRKILDKFPGYRMVSLKEGIARIYHSLSEKK
jgi:UDP-glucose 4-epimerase